MRLILLILASTLLMSCTTVQDRKAANDPRRDRLAARLPSLLERSHTPSVAIALIEDGRLRWTLITGEQAPGIPASEATLYNVASLTKPVAAEAALRQLSADRAGLDDPLAKHWVDPDLAQDPRHTALTVRRCLSHQCGLPNWRSDTDGVLKLLWEPGSRAEYSGEGYEYVARYLHKRTGLPFAELAGRHVFVPLHMTRTSFVHRPWFDERVALPRGPEGEYGKPADRREASAADDLHATIADYGAFVASVLRQEGLSPAIAEQRWLIEHDVSQQVCQPGRLQGADCPRRMGFALGWVRFETAKDTVFFHGGGDWGERSFAFFVPSRQSGIVVLTNGASGMAVIRDVIAELHDDPALIAFLTMQAGN